MSKKVLLVEDSENDIVLMRRTWNREGIQCDLEVVTDGRQALEYLVGSGQYANREQYPLPCLVLLDLKLPHIMGLDLLAWIRRQPSLKTLPVLVMTTSACDHEVDDAYRRGANAFLVKPSDVMQLANLVRLIRDFWLAANYLPNLANESAVTDWTGNIPHTDL